MPITNNNRLSSPGVQISEVDLTLRAAPKIGTNVFVCGFAPQGPSDEIIQVNTRSEFIDIYGTPTNAAERYFYHTVSQLFNSPVNVLVNRLPYGSNSGEGFSQSFYSALVYPVSAYTAFDGTLTPALTSNLAYSATNQISTYILGAPYLVNLPLSAYNALQDGNGFTWSPNSTDLSSILNYNNTALNINDIAGAGVIILNGAQVANNGRFEGYYTALVDNTNYNPATPFDDVEGIKVVSNTYNAYKLTDPTYASLMPPSRITFELAVPSTGIPTGNSVSEVIEAIPSYNLNTRGFDDTLTLAVFKLRQSTFSPDTIKLDYVYQEGYIGSLDYNRQINDSNGGKPVSFFLPNVARNSPNVNVLVNPYISGEVYNSGSVNYRTTTWLGLDGTPKTKVRIATGTLENLGTTVGLTNTEYTTVVGAPSATIGQAVSGIGSDAGYLWAQGVFTPTQISNKEIGSIPQKLDRVFDRISNTDVYDIDIIPDAGLSTIFTTVTLLSADYFDDTVNMEAYVSDLRTAKPTTEVLAAQGNGEAVITDWNTIYTKFINFCQFVRQDCLYIADVYRNILVDGPNLKVISEGNYNFGQFIYSPFKHLLYNANSSYGCIYSTWAKVYDSYSGSDTWIPFSGVAAQLMGNTDANFKPWYAPAGFTRGLVSTVNDIAFYPNQAQRDQLYPISVNPVAFFPGEGFVVMGQKTLQQRPSAFDRINVRRLFLVLEKSTKFTSKYFVFEPNTLFTRTNLVNVINPIFSDAKNTEGLYDYLIVCDERNNTPEVIDQNQLIVDIYIKPVRTAEFILVNFVATRTSQNFQEIVG